MKSPVCDWFKTVLRSLDNDWHTKCTLSCDWFKNNLLQFYWVELFPEETDLLTCDWFKTDVTGLWLVDRLIFWHVIGSKLIWGCLCIVIDSHMYILSCDWSKTDISGLWLVHRLILWHVIGSKPMWQGCDWSTDWTLVCDWFKAVLRLSLDSDWHTNCTLSCDWFKKNFLQYYWVVICSKEIDLLAYDWLKLKFVCAIVMTGPQTDLLACEWFKTDVCMDCDWSTYWSSGMWLVQNGSEVVSVCSVIDSQKYILSCDWFKTDVTGLCLDHRQIFWLIIDLNWSKVVSAK